MWYVATRGQMEADQHVDIADPALYALGNPFGAYAWFREHEPVFRQAWRGGETIVNVLRHADVCAIYRDHSHYSSAHGTLLTRHALKANPASGQMLALTDPPRHTQLRRALAPHFSPQRLRELEVTIRDTIVESISQAVFAPECDFVHEVAAAAPLVAACNLLGVPSTDRALMFRLTSCAFGPDNPDAQTAAHQEILFYFHELQAERRRHPSEDVISTLVTSRIDGELLSEEEIALNCDNILVGGVETTRHAASGAVLEFATNPGQWSHVRAGRVEMRRVIEEILRWTTPATHLLRTATRPSALRGVKIEPGDVVVLWNLSANRDESVFADADRFDAARVKNPHVALGVGHHFCIGSFLARLELHILFSELAARVANFEVTGRPRRLRSNMIYGLEYLPIALQPAPAAS